MNLTVTITVNGKPVSASMDSRTLLVQFIREHLQLTGTHVGCDTAQCGACTVLVDGQMTRSCVTQVGKVAGKQISTIEGLEKDGQLHPLQQAFIEADALQCGYCTSGMIMSGVALLKKNPKPSRAPAVCAGGPSGMGVSPQVSRLKSEVSSHVAALSLRT